MEIARQSGRAGHIINIKTMPIFRINYSFNGCGSCEVEADNEDEARDKWYDGSYDDDNESTDNYEIDDVVEVDENGNEVSETTAPSLDNRQKAKLKQ